MQTASQSGISIFTSETGTINVPGTLERFDFQAFCQKHAIRVSDGFLTTTNGGLILFGLPAGAIDYQVLGVGTPAVRIFQDTSILGVKVPTFALIMCAVNAEVTMGGILPPDVSSLFFIKEAPCVMVRWRSLNGVRELEAIEIPEEQTTWPAGTHVWHCST